MWLIARLVVMLVVTASIVVIPEGRSNLNWGACFFISAISAAFLFGWLTVVRFKPGIDWSEPYSWEQPFLPMNRYPLRYWFVVSISCMFAGAAAMLREVVRHGGSLAFGGTFFFLGLFVGVALKVWIAKNAPGIRRSGP